MKSTGVLCTKNTNMKRWEIKSCVPGQVAGEGPDEGVLAGPPHALCEGDAAARHEHIRIEQHHT